MPNQFTDTPVLLIVFNRPDKVRQLLVALATIKPTKVYVAADGPRGHKESDAPLCAEVRELVANISWPDCIPSTSVFEFTTELLHRYKSDERVMHISGSSFIDSNKQTNPSDSYHISNTALVWGWATWRRAWEKYDITMSGIDELSKEMDQANTFGSRIYRYFWISLFRHLNSAQVDTWDGQWLYSILKNNGVCITPATNLIENIGFDADATHTTETIAFARGRQEMEFPLTHPQAVKVDTQADQSTMRTAFVCTPKQKLNYFIKSYLSL